MLIGIGSILMGLGGLIYLNKGVDNLLGLLMFSLGLYSVYKYIIESTTKKEGIKSSIIIATIGLMGIITICMSYMGVSLLNNIEELGIAWFTYLASLFETLFSNLDKMSKFIEELFSIYDRYSIR